MRIGFIVNDLKAEEGKFTTTRLGQAAVTLIFRGSERSSGESPSKTWMSCFFVTCRRTT